MPTVINLWFDFASTYSYPAIIRLQKIAPSAEIRIHWRPFLLGAIFQQQGLNDSSFNLHPEKGRYMWRDIERICTAAGIPYQQPSQFPRNGLLASRITCCFEDAEWITGFIQQVFIANFYNNSDIADSTVIARILTSLGLNSEDILSKSSAIEAKEKLRNQTEQAKEKRIFGAPTLMIGEEMFWGHDRIDQAVDFALGRYPLDPREPTTYL